MDFYQKNLKLLRKKDRRLAQRLEALEGEIAIEVLKTRTPFPSLKIMTDGGKSIVLHSTYDPIGEARRLLESARLREKVNVSVLGLGLGYHVLEMMKMEDKFGIILAVESNPGIFKTAMHLVDMSPMLTSKKVVLAVGENPLDLQEMIGNLSIKLISRKMDIVEHPVSIRLSPEYYREVRRRVPDAFRLSLATVVTNMIAGRTLIKNLLLNLPEIVRNPGIKNLFGRFSGVPAIIISAGPSLDKNIKDLKIAKGKALLISTDTALKALLSHNLKPDLVVTVDYKPGSRKHFLNVEVDDDIYLVFDVEVTPAVLSVFKGPKFVETSTKSLSEWINGITGDKGILLKGMCVAHIAFSLAEALGSKPIIFVGQDLSYPGGVTHARGTASRVAIEKLRKGNERYMMKVPDIYGNEVETSRDMYVYLRQFESLISRSDRLCIDATEGGALIEGTEIMTLKEALGRYCTQERKIAEVLREASRKRDVSDRERVIEEMEKMMERIKKVQRSEEKILYLLDSIAELESESPSLKEIHRLMSRLSPPCRQVRKEEEVLEFIQGDIIDKIMKIEERSLSEDREEEKDVHQIIGELKQDRELHQAIKDSVEFLLACFRESRDNLKALKNCSWGKYRYPPQKK